MLLQSSPRRRQRHRAAGLAGRTGFCGPLAKTRMDLRSFLAGFGVQLRFSFMYTPDGASRSLGTMHTQNIKARFNLISWLPSRIWRNCNKKGTSYPPCGVVVYEREAARGVASLFEAEIRGGRPAVAAVGKWESRKRSPR